MRWRSRTPSSVFPPYHAGSQREIVGSRRAYAFDTGLVAHERGWDSTRDEDRGLLWENLVLDELRCRHPPGNIHFWRDKSGREVDFVIRKPRGRADAFEAKISPDAFDPGSLRAFRGLHPEGDNFLICPLVRDPYTIRKGDLSVRVCTL